jgi:small multidrug resistance pump
MLGWIYLMLAIFLEIAGTTCMKLSAGLTNLWPSIFIFVFYGLCFIVFPQALKRIEVGVAYGVWSGLGAVIVTLIGVLYLHESLNLIKSLGIVIVILGVIGLKLSSTSLTKEES